MSKTAGPGRGGTKPATAHASKRAQHPSPEVTPWALGRYMYSCTSCQCHPQVFGHIGHVYLSTRLKRLFWRKDARMAQRWPTASRPTRDARMSRAPARGAPAVGAPEPRRSTRA
eukprot:6790622-Prymnesium_polylepis.3